MYEFYVRIDKLTNRAPSLISLAEEYELVGTSEATSRSEAVRNWFNGELSSEYSERVSKPKVGDVVRDWRGDCFILCPEGLWALVATSS